MNAQAKLLLRAKHVAVSVPDLAKAVKWYNEVDSLSWLNLLNLDWR